MRRPMHVFSLCTVLCTVALMAGCAAWQGIMDTPQERYIYAAGLYNDVHDQYKVDAARPDLTEAEKNFLQEKKRVIDAADEVFDRYEKAVTAGLPPSEEILKELESIIDELLLIQARKAVK